MRRRLAKVQEKVSPEHDGSFTLEEVCRLLWRRDRKQYMELVAEGFHLARFFKEQFEREEAATGSTGRVRRSI
jgi:hypothetical protein